jgi:hypothetical protein
MRIPADTSRIAVGGSHRLKPWAPVLLVAETRSSGISSSDSPPESASLAVAVGSYGAEFISVGRETHINYLLDDVAWSEL